MQRKVCVHPVHFFVIISNVTWSIHHQFCWKPNKTASDVTIGLQLLPQIKCQFTSFVSLWSIFLISCHLEVPVFYILLSKRLDDGLAEVPAMKRRIYNSLAFPNMYTFLILMMVTLAMSSFYLA